MDSDSEATSLSRFDDFVEGFAARNLNSRVKKVAVFLLLLIGTTCAALGFFLNRDLTITADGMTSISADGTLSVVLDKNHRKEMSAHPELFLGVDENHLSPVVYSTLKVQDVGEQGARAVFSLTAPNALPSPIHYKIVVVRKKYWDLLFMKSEGWEVEE